MPDFPGAFELPDYLKRHLGFTGPCRQVEQNARLPQPAPGLQHGDDGAIDGGFLIVARLWSACLIGVAERLLARASVRPSAVTQRLQSSPRSGKAVRAMQLDSPGAVQSNS